MLIMTSLIMITNIEESLIYGETGKKKNHLKQRLTHRGRDEKLNVVPGWAVLLINTELDLLPSVSFCKSTLEDCPFLTWIYLVSDLIVVMKSLFILRRFPLADGVGARVGLICTGSAPIQMRITDSYWNIANISICWQRAHIKGTAAHPVSRQARR